MEEEEETKYKGDSGRREERRKEKEEDGAFSRGEIADEVQTRLHLHNRYIPATWTNVEAESSVSSMMASKAWKVVQPHVPMIKFRKGGIDRAAVAGTTTAPSTRSGSAQMQKSAGGATGPQVIVLPTIEDIHLPPRYQRRPIDEKEIEYINVSFDGYLNCKLYYECIV
ncbi:hypothetical protein ALC53_02752 [Atta colombica]|uniref:28S ribosomal protein S36, mitochondrial n=1 Tax=Atta colombica TaxID=520822 RepID=A0A195BP30_9HYME|nr:hypothetical protein ALC53_02752 [Atta colombica]